MKPIKSHCAMVGMATVVDDFPIYYEATNEKGLSMAGLNFPENAVYCNFASRYGFVDDSNLMWDIANAEPYSSSVRYNASTNTYTPTTPYTAELMQKNGLYTNVVMADPLFVDPLNGDFTLVENSPALSIGFVPIDMSNVGIRN